MKTVVEKQYVRNGKKGVVLYGNHAEWRGFVWEPCRMQGLCMGTMQNGGALYGNHAEWKGFVWEPCMESYHGTFSEMI